MAPAVTASAAAAIVIVIVSVLHTAVLLFQPDNRLTINKQIAFLSQIYQILGAAADFLYAVVRRAAM
jgi:hypothetical protein